MLTSVSDSVSYAASADLVIAMAGYNTTAEILSVGAPALLVPRHGPSAEQQMRARLFAERGWVDWLHPQDVSADSLVAAVATALDRPTPPAPVPPPDLAGRRAGSDRLLDSLRERRSLRTVPLAPLRPATAAAGQGRDVRDDDCMLA